MNEKPREATEKEKSDAFKWLRCVALEEGAGSFHAAVILQELQRLVPRYCRKLGSSSDLSRSEAIEWCRNKGATFIQAIYPPPSGWFWCKVEDESDEIVLSAIFTSRESLDIAGCDVFLHLKHLQGGR